jgi:hypothetical protein
MLGSMEGHGYVGPIKRTCRALRTHRRQVSWQEVFPHARIINDPKKLAQLNAEVEKRKHDCYLAGS